MLQYTPLTPENAAPLQSIYARCTYRLCEYSLGVKLMWRAYLHPAFAFACGCLIVRNVIRGAVCYDYPVPAAEDADVEGALLAIEQDCMDRETELTISVVPEEAGGVLLRRYPRFRFTNEAAWGDYLYRAEDLIGFAGRRYSGQRNHIHRFRREHPDAAFCVLTEADLPMIRRFWEDYGAEFQKDGEVARRELSYAAALLEEVGRGFFCAGGLAEDGRLLALALGERCGNTLTVHVEKALYSCPGAYPALVQAFAAAFAGDLAWINREDDGRDKGLRTSKQQYLPAAMGAKLRFCVENELYALQEIPTLTTQRLTLTPLYEEDKAAYNALCLDDERNRWWGYDYRQDLQGPWTEDYFLHTAREDFAAHTAVNFAVRWEGECIGEVVLYRFDHRGGAELGCRIAPAYAGHGYGTEAFAAIADWGLYHLRLARIVAKCYHENRASYRMLASCMRLAGSDETFDYFEKTV